MLTTLNTARLNLDVVTTADSDFIRELVNTKGWLKFIGDRNVHSKEDSIAYIKKILGMPAVTYWVVKTKESDIPVGIISFIKRLYLEHYDIGFAFLPEHHGKGYAYEATSAVLVMLAEDPLYSIIMATTIPTNTRSIQLLKSLGFRFSKAIENENDILHVYANTT